MLPDEKIAIILDDVPALLVASSGIDYGPCRETCSHEDCTWQRATVSRLCLFCHQSIGHHRYFYLSCGDAMHRDCLEAQFTNGDET